MKIKISPFNQKNILITGGTGSLGKALTYHLLKYYTPNTIRILSRDEMKQWEMKKHFSSLDKKGLLRFFLGDVREKSRLHRAFENVDIVIHAAALKQVPACEYNPIEAIRTNIEGAINVIDAALDNEVEKIIALSTDKASQPVNLYGATKLCSDKLFINANNYRGFKKTAFSVVRYGNVIGSRGSVVPLFTEQAQSGVLTITDKEMTRFWITLSEAVKFIISSLEIMQGGELFVPKIPSMKLLDLVRAIAPNAKLVVSGIRPGEKLHESLISSDEARNTIDLGDRYVIQPENVMVWNPKHYKNTKPVDRDFSYYSQNNTDFLSTTEMKEKIKQASYEDNSL